ncbi:MAG: DNA methylase, partial [Candidatus Thermofonsia Clade 1 bacterium]
SRYSGVIYTDGRPVDVREALTSINRILDETLAHQEGELDAESRFAVAWFEQHSFEEGAFGDADVLARAKNTSVDDLERLGVLIAAEGKVRLRKPEAYDPSAWDRRSSRASAWLATHHLIVTLSGKGEKGASELVANIEADVAERARQLAYRLYSICERKGWAELGFWYNALVSSW